MQLKWPCIGTRIRLFFRTFYAAGKFILGIHKMNVDPQAFKVLNLIYVYFYFQNTCQCNIEDTIPKSESKRKPLMKLQAPVVDLH
jgi:hypothetical protein